jgi:hypothetical protein
VSFGGGLFNAGFTFFCLEVRNGRLVCIVRGDKFQLVTEALLKISQEKLPVSSTLNVFSAKTFSMVGVDFRCVRSGNFSKISKFFEERYTVDKGVYPMVSVTCSPGDMHQVFKYASVNLGKGTTTFGGRDFLFVPSKCKTWGQLIANVLKMRRDLSNSLYSTAIDILCPTFIKKLPHFPSKRKTTQRIVVDSSLLEEFARWPEFRNRLLNLYFGIGNLIQDPLIGDCFKDLRMMTAFRLPELLRNLHPDDPDACRA